MSNVVSLVLISHSHELVIGLKKLLHQIQPEVKVAIAGGEEGNIGTNALNIKEAIESVYRASGVVILFDLGSALMNAELAIDLIDNQSHVMIADAPLAEGAYVASIEAGCGSSLQDVVKAAESAKTLNKLS